MHARNYTAGQQMRGGTSFPANSRLRNYSPHGGGFYANVGNDGALRGDDGNIIARTAYTDGVLTEEITYTVAKVPKDYSFDTVTEADYKYKEYVMAD